MQNCHIETSLLDLAYLYLTKKCRKENKQISDYCFADLLEICEEILHWSEQTNQFNKKPRLIFKNDELIVSENILK